MSDRHRIALLYEITYRHRTLLRSLLLFGKRGTKRFVSQSYYYPLLFHLFPSVKYLPMEVTAFAPSAAAVMTCLSAFVLTSPAAKTPGIDVTQLSSAFI